MHRLSLNIQLRTIFLLCSCLLLQGVAGTNLYAQQDFLDSLKRELHIAPDDTTKVKLLNALCFKYHIINPDSAMEYCRAGEALTRKLDWEKGEAMIYNSLGAVYRIKSDYSTALDNFFKALEINERIGEQKGMAFNYGNIGIVYKTQQDYANALKYYKMALRTYEAMSDSNGIAINYGNIGIIYETLGDYNQSLEYQEKALEINTATGNRRSVAHNLGNIGILYNAMGDYARSLEYLFKALALNEKLGIKNAMANNYRGIGNVYCNMAKDSTASSSARKQAALEATKYLNSGLAIAQELGDKKNLQEMNDLQAKAYMTLGDYRMALEKYRQYVLYKDSIFSAENSEKITTLITRRELDIRDKEIQIRDKQIELDRLAVAKKNNERGFFIAGIGLLFITTLIIFRYYKKQIRTNQLLEKEKQKSDDLLLNILPSEVADELKDRGATTARYFDSVTILFTDFVDFTGAGERMTSQQLVEELHTCFKAFDEIIGKHHIEKIKTIGDAYLAVCGLPIADSRHAENVVNAAKDIIVFMKARRQQLGDKTFEIRIGVNSGNVVAGIVGVKKFAYDIWGDTVNTAARMESNSLPGKINISQTTYELVRDKFTCTYRGELEAKNKGKLNMYFVES